MHVLRERTKKEKQEETKEILRKFRLSIKCVSIVDVDTDADPYVKIWCIMIAL